MKPSDRTFLLLSVFVIVGTILRFYNIVFQTSNYDENFTLTFVAPSLSWMQLMVQTLTVDYTPPLYYLAAHASMLVFGATIEAIRIPSAICGVLLIPVMYLLGKDFRDDLFGLIVAGFVTIFYNSVFYSMYGRPYAMELLFFTLTFWMFIRLLKGRDCQLWFAGFALLTLWTQLYTSIAIGLMILCLIYYRTAFRGIVCIIIGSLPLLNYIPIILTTRDYVVYGGTNNFSATPLEILFLEPVDLFGYSAIIITPILIWGLWNYRNEIVVGFISVVSIVSWVSLFIISLKTPVILHYILYLVPMLILVLILPFYEVIKKNAIEFHHIVMWIVIALMEALQIYFIHFVQRMG